ncbi:MAG: hypothetical protein K0R51_922 [Cytophagaceae bacterium]|jgi:hypothetical protein|nr:hypothetical protein [Cytophagaceae bacterium]
MNKIQWKSDAEKAIAAGCIKKATRFEGGFSMV